MLGMFDTPVLAGRKLLFNGALTTEATFTRASSAYAWVNNVFTSFATNVPRFGSYEGGDTYTGFVTEGAGTNLCLQSQAINTSPWLAVAGASVTANTVVSPDGTQNADTLTFDAQINSRVEQSLENLGLGITVTMSVYLRVASGTRTVRVGIDDSGSYYTDVVVTSAWQRFSVTTEVLPFVGGAAYPRISNSPDSAAGDVYVWGFQVEVNSFATTYIPTTSAAVTRAADVCAIASLNTKPWWNAAAGTYLVNYKSNAGNSSYFYIVSADNGGSGERVEVRQSAATVVEGNVVTSSTDFPITGTTVAGTATKAAYAFAAADYAMSVNAAAVTTGSTPATIPSSLVNLRIGQIVGGSGITSFYGTIQSITYYPRRLPNATLQNITA